MEVTNFDKVHSAITESVKDSAWKGVTYGNATGLVLRQRAQNHHPENDIYYGRVQSVEGTDTHEFDNRMTAVFTTDYAVRPPITRWLVRTAVGRFAGIAEGESETVLNGAVDTLHPDTTAFGRSVIETMLSQLDHLQTPVSAW